MYLGNDPLVLAHARALLIGTTEGRTDYLDTDLRDVDTILASAAKKLDLSQPVALVLLGGRYLRHQGDPRHVQQGRRATEEVTTARPGGFAST